MEPLGLNEIRERFLQFFESKQHLRLPSFSLIPKNDKSLLLINAGMAPLKPFFTGQEIPPNKRVTTCQKCIRTGDIENVGKTARHGTFFEMLGNFSFGDYFKEEIIPWSWEFVTEWMDIPADKLYVSIYEDDDEAFEIWNKKVGLAAERIFRMGKEDNFWELGLGPCGPCSEIYYDRGPEYGCGKEGCTVGCDCDRYLEFWNLVFTQFNKGDDGTYSKLTHPNIDTGMGLERMAAMMQQVDSIFDVDTIKAVRDHVCRIAGVTYHEDIKTDVSIRIITDHIRSVTFMTADGVLPSNEGRGYVLRRLLRRAARHGKLLGIKDTFLSGICQTVIDVSGKAYPELAEKQVHIFKVIDMEEKRFSETIDLGMELLKTHVGKLKEAFAFVLGGSIAFRLYDTYGFPLELMQEILEDEGIRVDEEAFWEEMNKQKERARHAREETNFSGAEETVYNHLDPALFTLFTGYEEYEAAQATITAIIVDGQIVEEAVEGDKTALLLDKTPLYAESGGQKGDSGQITIYGADDASSMEGHALIHDCVKVGGNKFIHLGKVTTGRIKVGDRAQVSVDKEKRLAIARNHTATHLLQKALREVLGNHVEQAGSYVASDRLRFDFTHFAPLTKEELLQVENLVNDNILEGLLVNISEKDMEEARAMGAMALFGEKYENRVRVVDIGGYSIELCGGTHLNNTARIGVFKIVSEGGIASGVRRIEALTGKGALSYYREMESRLDSIGNIIKTAPENIVNRIKNFMLESRQMSAEMERLKAKMAGNLVDELLSNKKSIGEIDMLCTPLPPMDAHDLRTLGDKLKDKIKSGLIILASPFDGKVNLLVMATDDTVKKGVNAGAIVKESAEAVGGRGGGRPNMAQAGLKDPEKIMDLLNKAADVARTQVK